MAPLAARFCGDPTAELRVVGDHRHEREDDDGVPGPPRSSRRAGIQTGLLGTVKQVVGGVEEEVERTTPEAIDLQATFRRMLDAGDRACAMEVSSHALALRPRRRRSTSRSRVFTNLTQDHLDFHADMEDYFLAKRRLFEGGRAERLVVNVDDPYGDRLAAEFDPITFSATGAERADLRAVDLRFDASGSTLPAARPRTARRTVELPLPGHFNVANALGALACASALGVGLDDAAAALAERRPGAGPLRAGRRGPAVRGPGRLRAHAGLARERAARPRAG